jgi:hypothetical protein
MTRFILLLLAALLLGATVATAAPRTSYTTIDLRACVDGGDGACFTAGDVYVDGVGICYLKAGGVVRCGVTEDGEHMFDSQPPGSYRAYVNFLPEGYRLDRITVTTYPNIPYQPSSYHKARQRVSFNIKRDVVAVAVNVLLIADGEEQ